MRRVRAGVVMAGGVLLASSAAVAAPLDGDCFVAQMTSAQAALFAAGPAERAFLVQLEPADRDALMSRWGEACGAPVADRARLDDLLLGVQAEQATRRRLIGTFGVDPAAIDAVWASDAVQGRLPAAVAELRAWLAVRDTPTPVMEELVRLFVRELKLEGPAAGSSTSHVFSTLQRMEAETRPD